MTILNSPLTLVLTLALIDACHPTVKEKKKQLIRLLKTNTGAAATVINHVLRNNQIGSNIQEVVSDHLRTLERISIASACGAQGLVTIGYKHHPIFIDVACKEDKDYALQSETAILQTAVEQARRMGYHKGSTAVCMLFIADGFSGLPVTLIL